MTEDEVAPRVWPVFLSYAGVLVGSLMLGVLLVILAVTVDFARNPEADHGPEAVARVARSLTESPGFLLASSMVLYAILIPLPLIGARLGGEPVSTRLRLAGGRREGLAVLLATAGLLGLSQMFDSSLALMEWNPGGTIELLSRTIGASTGPTLGVVVLMVGPVAGFAEELFFRGFMQTRLRDRWGSWPAIVVTAAAFGLLHLDPVHSPLAFAIGLFLGWVTELTGSIRSAVAAHAINNTVSVLGIALLPGASSPAVQVWLLVAAILAATVSVVCLGRFFVMPDAGITSRNPG